ncbi:MAG: hypothetical protein F6J93_27800 [Oscillatoria sp. SIO1A7]|nr:hypothetical protein [Oscillatoria sp. SIO1A7]
MNGSCADSTKDKPRIYNSESPDLSLRSPMKKAVLPLEVNVRAMSKAPGSPRKMAPGEPGAEVFIRNSP